MNLQFSQSFQNDKCFQCKRERINENLMKKFVRGNIIVTILCAIRNHEDFFSSRMTYSDTYLLKDFRFNLLSTITFSSNNPKGYFP